MAASPDVVMACMASGRLVAAVPAMEEKRARADMIRLELACSEIERATATVQRVFAEACEAVTRARQVIEDGCG